MSVRLLLCVNHPANGEPTGRIVALEILDVIALEAPEPAPACLIRPSRGLVRLAGRTYRLLGYAAWVGNWCWDEVALAEEDAVDILDRLRKTERWACTEAESGVYRKWERGEKIVAEDLCEDADG